MTTRRTLIAALAALAASAGPAVSSASAAIPCQTYPTTQAFLAVGDKGYYFAAPGGTFEAGTTPWTFTRGAGVTAGQSPLLGFGLGLRSAFLLSSSATATSPAFCISANSQTVRLTANRLGLPGSVLHIDVISRNPSSGAVGTASTDIRGDFPGWTTSVVLNVPAVFDAAGHEDLQIAISERGTPALWLVDDVAVDPLKTN